MIKQRSWGDCGVVTLINALNDSGMTYFNGPFGYEQMVSLLSGRDSGLTIQEVSAVLFINGFSPTYLPFEGFRAASGISNAYIIGDYVIKHRFKGEKAIFQVKTKSGLLHFVYFDGDLIWDPSVNAPEYPGFDDYEAVVDVVFFKPTAFRKRQNRAEFIRGLVEKSKFLQWCQKIKQKSKSILISFDIYLVDKILDIVQAKRAGVRYHPCGPIGVKPENTEIVKPGEEIMASGNRRPGGL